MQDRDIGRQLEQLHEASFGWALSCCGGNPDEAAEVLQNAYLKVLDGRARFGGRSSFKTWLFSVIRLTAADQRRKHALRWNGLVRLYQRSTGDPDSNGPERDVHRGELRDRFRSLLQRLPNRQREVIHLVFYHDHTLRQAAEIMGVSLGSARTHYHRGKQRLRQWLQELEDNA